MSDDMREQVARYDDLVAKYHELDELIDTLIHEAAGHSENMSEESRERYRQLARQRDEVLNQMREMEQELFSDSDE